MPVNISVTAGDTKTLYSRGPELLGEKLDLFATSARGFTEPLRKIGMKIQARVAGEFASQGTIVYGPWAPLSEPYGSWKEQHAPGTPILVGIRPLRKGTREHPTRPQTYTRSGRMRLEMLDPAAVHVDPVRMLYTPESNIAGFHQTGTERMPARPMIALAPYVLHEFDREFVSYLARLQKEAGL